MPQRPRQALGEPLVRVRTELVLDATGLAALGAAALCSALLLEGHRQPLLSAFAIQTAVIGCVLSAIQLRALRRARLRSAPSGTSLEDDAATARRVSRRLVVLTPILAAIMFAVDALDPGRPPVGIVAGSLVGVGLGDFLVISWVLRFERENELLLLFHRRRFGFLDRVEWSEHRTYYTARPGSLKPHG